MLQVGFRISVLLALFGAPALVGCKAADPPAEGPKTVRLKAAPAAPDAGQDQAAGKAGKAVGRSPGGQKKSKGADPLTGGQDLDPTQPGTSLAGIPIINVHEHIQSIDEADRLLKAMDQTGIARTVLVGSSWFTVTLNQKDGFTRVDWNNRQILNIARRHAKRFMAWPTLDPQDPQKLEKLKEYVSLGATGLKLYLGHGLHDQRPGATGYFFHTVAMDDPGMLPVYAYLQKMGLPIMFHVNPGPKAPGFADEFIDVMRAHPDLKVIVPHFMLSSIRSSRLRAFLDAFPTVYSDISFGHDDFLRAGLKRISRRPDKFRKLFADYPDRFTFGTDVVVTAAPQKDAEWIAVRVRAYLDMLTKTAYTTPILPGRTLRGLALDRAAVAKVLHENFERFIAMQPKGTETGPIDWKQLGVPDTPRPDGQMLPRDAWDAHNKKKGRR